MEELIPLIGGIVLLICVYKANRWKKNDCAKPCPLCGTKSPADRIYLVNHEKMWMHKCPKCEHHFYSYV